MYTKILKFKNAIPLLEVAGSELLPTIHGSNIICKEGSSSYKDKSFVYPLSITIRFNTFSKEVSSKLNSYLKTTPLDQSIFRNSNCITYFSW